MSQSGKLIFYSVKPLDDPSAILRSIVTYLKPRCIFVVSRSKGESREWEDFLAGKDKYDSELFPRLPDPLQVGKYYEEGKLLSAQLDGSPVSAPLMKAVEAGIPAAIRGDFLPSDPIIKIGWHDLWECSEDDKGVLFARAFLSVGFFGYSTPFDWKAFRRAVFELPDVQAIRSDLSKIVGEQLEQVIYWNA